MANNLGSLTLRKQTRLIANVCLAHSKSYHHNGCELPEVQVLSDHVNVNLRCSEKVQQKN